MSACQAGIDGPITLEDTANSTESIPQTYFPHVPQETRPLTAWWESFATQLETFEEPSLWEASQSGQSTDSYRVLFYNYHLPVHVIRIDVEVTGSASITMKRNIRGTGRVVRDRAEACKRGGVFPRNNSGAQQRDWTRCVEDGLFPPKQTRPENRSDLKAFTDNAGWQRFWDVDIGDAQAASIEPVKPDFEDVEDGDRLCLHTIQFIFEALVDGKYRVLQDDTCDLTSISALLGPAFYRMAEIGPEDTNWTYYTYFDMGEGEE